MKRAVKQYDIYVAGEVGVEMYGYRLLMLTPQSSQ